VDEQPVTQVELGKILGMSQSAVSQHIAKGNIPQSCFVIVRENGKKYKKILPSCAKQALSQIIGKPRSKGPAAPKITPVKESKRPAGFVPRAEAEEKIANLKAALLQIEVQKERGELKLAEDIKKEWIAMVTAIKNTLVGLPNRISALVAVSSDQRECRKIIESEVRHALTSLADGVGEPCPHCGRELKVF
jgi:hypothetical protein